jgi:hypothetical protein
MRGKYKAYLFERFENYGTVETKGCLYGILTTETIQLEAYYASTSNSCLDRSPWGKMQLKIHNAWLHRLANLTLTAYNPDLSNSTFAEKRNAPKGGI